MCVTTEQCVCVTTEQCVCVCGGRRVGFLPAGVRRRFEAALCVALPHAVGQLVADGGHDLDYLQGPLVQVQRAHARQVSAQVTVDA